MNDFDLFFTEGGNEELVMCTGPSEGELVLDRPIIKGIDDYDQLKNLPRINGHPLIGDQTGFEIGLQDVLFGITEHWNNQRDYIANKGQIVIYMDHGTVEDDEGNVKEVPGIKIGDGNAYLIDLPFVGDDVADVILTRLNNHLANQDIHVSAADRLKWDKKVDVRMVNDDLGETEIVEFFRE